MELMMMNLTLMVIALLESVAPTEPRQRVRVIDRDTEQWLQRLHAETRWRD